MHDPDQPCIAEEILAKLIPALIRSGTIHEDVILRLADDIDREAEDETITRAEELEAMATALRFWAIASEEMPPPPSPAQKRRSRFRVIDGG